MVGDPITQKRLGSALFYCIVILLVYLVYLIFAPFLVALSWAAVLTVVCYPVFELMAEKWGRTKAAAISTVAVTVVLIVPALFVTVAFVRQGIGAAQSVRSAFETGSYPWVGDLWARIQDWFPSTATMDVTEAWHRYAEEIARYGGSQLGFILRHAARFVLHLGVTIVAMFYLFRDGDAIVMRLREALPFEAEHRDRMLEQARNMIFATVTSSVVSAATHGTLGGAAFAIAGVNDPIFWGVMMGFCSLVPVVGTALVWLPISISVIASGHMGRAIALIVFCILIGAFMDYVIRPWLISGHARIGGLLVFISVLGGIEAFGMLGIVLGPMILAMAASVFDVYVPSARAGNKGAAAIGKKARAVLE